MGLFRRVQAVGKRVRESLSSLSMLNAFYDSASAGGVNEAHWAAAGSLSARQVNAPHVRETLRDRARYEIANNSVARGMVNTYADDLIGDGARLQIKANDAIGVSRADAQSLERAWNDWCDACDFWGKVSTVAKADCTDGEIFGVFDTNEIHDHPVSLNLVLVEAERVCNPFSIDLDLSEVDGIKFDSKNNPTKYRVLKYHPDDEPLVDGSPEPDWIPASNVIHYFRADRAGQVRGIPQLTPALPLFAQLRRFISATLTAAEVAAKDAKVIYTDTPADTGDEIIAPEVMNSFELPEGLVTALPDGWKLGQNKAEHPITTFSEFRREILSEAGRCLSMPLNIVLANSSGYNYSSGKLDHATYFHKIKVDRRMLRVKILDRVFRRWLEEAVLVEDLIPQVFRTQDIDLQFAWMWPMRQHADPSKEAKAAKDRIDGGYSNLIIECANLGNDWQDVLDGELEVQRYRESIGLKDKPTPVTTKPTRKDEGDDDE